MMALMDMPLEAQTIQPAMVQRSADWRRFQQKHVRQVVDKGVIKNFIMPENIRRIADTLIGWKEEEKLSRIVVHAELAKNDYNVSPSRYIHTSDAET